MRPNPALKRLGYAADDRVAIIHVDDVGMCHASIAAFAELNDFGLVSCGSVMVPCPWFLEAAKYARLNPSADLGVHLTLTSEWETYRWGPVSTRDPASGLLDEQGYLPRTSAEVQERGDPAAVQKEIVMQMERALAAGIRPSHADTHMGTVAHPKFMEGYISLALQYRCVPMMLRLDEEGWREINRQHTGAALDEQAIARAIKMVDDLEEMGIPLLDGLAGLSLEANPETRLEQAKAAFARLQPGITHFIIHAAQDTPELRAITKDWPCRSADYSTFMSEDLRAYLRDIGVQVIGYSQLQRLMPGS